MQLTKKEQYKVRDIMDSIYAGVVMAIDPTADNELYLKVSNRLQEDLRDLREALDIKF